MRIKLAAIIAGAALVLAAVPAWAHHAFAAEFDASKPITLHGTVTKVEWINPASGATVASENFRHDGGNRALSTPTYNVDIALRIRQRSQP